MVVLEVIMNPLEVHQHQEVILMSHQEVQVPLEAVLMKEAQEVLQELELLEEGVKILEEDNA